MKELEFKDYTATYEDADGDEHESTVRAAEVTDDLVYITDPNTGNRVRREVQTPVGGRQVSLGDVYVETDRPGVYDYHTGESWSAAGYAGDSEDAAGDSDEDTPKPVAKKAAAKRTLPDGSGS